MIENYDTDRPSVYFGKDRTTRKQLDNKLRQLVSISGMHDLALSSWSDGSRRYYKLMRIVENHGEHEMTINMDIKSMWIAMDGMVNLLFAMKENADNHDDSELERINAERQYHHDKWADETYG
jgi:hypothetical protein